jgi:AbrB family looped-hinge helix DNA binding protein
VSSRKVPKAFLLKVVIEFFLRNSFDMKIYKMEVTTISSNFQVAIPRRIRKQFNLKTGQKGVFLPYKKTLRMIIVPAIEYA